MKDLYLFLRKQKSTGISMIAWIIWTLVPQPVVSQVVENFTQRTSTYTPQQTIYSVKGDFALIGNTNLTPQSYTPTTLNSNQTMIYVDIDGDVNTINSSMATLQLSTENGAIPACSNIIYAGLYWTGRAHDGGDGTSPHIFTIDGNTADYYNTNIVNGYTLAISQTGESGTQRTATYTFTPVSGDAVVFTYITTGNTTNGTVTVQVGSGSPVSVPYTLSSGTMGDDWAMATFTIPYVINTGATTIVVNSLRKVRVNNTIDTDFRSNVTFGGNLLSKYQVKFKHGTDSYHTVTANPADIYYPSNAQDNMFAAYAEVTDYVKLMGTGQYTVADIALREGNGTSVGYYGGWGMIIIYENSEMKWRDITLFDGYAYNDGGNPATFQLPVSGFNTVDEGPVNMKLGMIAGEGDVTILGDFFQIINQSSAWVSLNHNLNATDNFFNSTINMNTGSGERNPGLINNTGLDIAMFNIPNNNNSIITNNQTSTTFRYGTTGDTYIIFCIAMSVDAYRPEVEGLLTVTEINNVPYTTSASADPGDIIEYTVDIRNIGSESINDGLLVIPLPYTAEFNSVSYQNFYLTGFGTPVYDASEGANGSIVWDLGTLPIPPDAGTLLATLTFSLQVTEDCETLILSESCALSVTVDGAISGVGAISSVPISSTPFIQGYEMSGDCAGTPIYDPVIIPVDAADYVEANCMNTPTTRNFYYCNPEGATIPITDVNGFFPAGTRFYNASWTTEYTISNPFPATVGTTTYKAVPPGISAPPEEDECYYTFTITVMDLSTSPTPVHPVYCQDDTAVPLTATPTDPDYTVYYYTTASGGTAQTSIIPSTLVPGLYTFYVSEGLSGDCMGPRVPLTVTVNARPDCLITGNNGPVCPLASNTYSAPTGMSSYLWSISGNGTISGSLTSSSVSVIAGAGCNVSYILSLTVANSFGCSRTCTKEVNVTAPALVVNAPANSTTSACLYSDQAAVNAAFTSWLAGFSVSGGCTPTGSYGTPVAPTLCTGGTTTVTYTYSDLCESGTVQASFTINAPTALTVNTPASSTTSSCLYADQAAVNAAFTTWLAGFSVSGGCTPTGSYGTPVAPTLCTGGTTTVTYTYSDLCESGTVQASFTINAPTALTVNTPASSTTSACAYADQAAVNTAFTSWLAGFSVSGGCTPTGSYGTPVAPTLCTGGTTTVTYTYSDLCESGTVQASFTINAPTALTVNAPANSTTSACTYSDQDAVNAAFTIWLAGFSVSGGCTPTGSYGTPVAPTLCTGGTTTVTYTYSDLCESGIVQASFTINAPTALTVNTPASSTTSACAYSDQAAVNAAFTIWLAGFSVSGGCTPTGSYGTPVAPTLCTGGTTTVTYTYSDLCESGTVQASFTINAPTALTVNAPANSTTSSCTYSDQDAVNAAFTTWLAGFSVSGGCTPTGSYGTPVAPTLCTGGTTTVTYTYSDLCESGTVQASFTINAPTALTVNAPANSTTSFCTYSDQDAVNAAFTTWLAGFSVSGGCTPTGSYGTPVAPTLCTGGTTTVTYTYSDLCESGTVQASFTINAPTALTVNTPASSTTSACAYSDQAAVNAAFTTWLAGFSVSGGCTPTGSYGTPVAPTLCTGGTTTVTYTYSDLCESGTVQASFTINAPTALTVNAPASSTTSACAYADQDAVNAAFTTWLAGFSVSGGCTPTGSYGTPVAPTLCTGGTTTVTYTYSDLCESGTVQASFTINAPTALTVNTPASSTTSACAYSDQAAVNAAFTTWLAGFGISGGCTPTGSYGTPVAPTLCTGGTTTVTYTYSDLCESGTVQASFTINAPTALTVNAPASSTTSACAYADQDAVNAAFTTWLAGFSVSGGCTPTGSYGTPVAPTLCTGGTTTVTYTYSDLCESGTVQASFTINAPTALTVNAPSNSTTSSCLYADQAAVNAAFTTWLAGFSVSGGCTPTGSYGTPVAPTLCTGGTTTVTYTYSDLCESGTVQASFTINAPTALTVNTPASSTTSACAYSDQDAVNAAFTTWLAGFSVSGGCTPTGSYGTPVAPALCTGGTTTVTYTYSDLCESGTVQASFTINAPTALTVNTPASSTTSACAYADQAAVNAAFTTWLAGFSVSGGCTPTGSYGTPVAPTLCTGGTITVTYTYSDLCESGTVQASFTINAPTALTVNTPANSTTSACTYSDQDAVNAAFTSWLAGFSVSGGCTPTGSYGTPVAPTLCTGGTTTVTYTYSDLCESGTVQSTFTINAPTELTVNAPSNSTTSSCLYADQAAVNAAFTTWLAGFSVSGGCTPTGSYGTPVAPTLCTGGTTTVTYTYSDLCESGTVQASFTINAPTALTVNAPANSTTSACTYSDQDAVNAAFTTWLAGFSVSGGCTPTGSYGTPVAPTLCTGGTTTVTYTYSDLCESGTVQASFTINAPTALTVNTPASSTTSACAYSDQAAVNAAFTTWLAGFGISGGCTPTGSYGTPVAPALCTGGTTTVTYTCSDLCESGTVQSTFTVNAPTALTVNAPANSTTSACAYADQAAVNTAFTTWLAGFSVSGGCTPTGSYGTPVAPTLCTGGTTTVTYTYSDLCESGTVQASFTINAPTELTVNTPASSTTSACAYADQDAVNAAFTTWLAGFSVSGGCTPTGSYGTPVAPTLCTGGTTTVTYTYSDLCESGTVQSSFTINAPTALTVNTPASSTTSACAYSDQDAVNAAFTTWLAGFSVSGGCTPTGSYGTPVAPALCTGGTTTVTYTYSDLCESGTVQASFTINAPTALTVNTPASSTTSACAYADQDAVNAAFTTWLAGFSVSGGCTPTGSYGAPVAPTLCTGGTTTVTYTYSDLCESGSVQSAFTVNAPTSLVISDPGDFSAPATDFADQAAINTAFASWLAGFGVTGGCDPQGSYGTPTAPTLCGGTTVVTYNVTDLCETGSSTASFTIISPNPLVINEPVDFVGSSCNFANQAALESAFTTWLTGFSVSGGFNPQGSIAGTPVAPVLCEGGTTSVTYNVIDECGTGSVTATFTINAPTALTVNTPASSTTSACAYSDQAAVNAAFTTWLAGFGISGGCTPTGSYGTPVAPTLCTGGTTTVTYTYSDLCESGTVQSTFTINAPTALTVNTPASSTTSACAYADQAAVNAAFTTWLAGFSVSGGCTPTGSYGTPVAPTLCTGGTTTVTYTYSDLCESGTVQASFTINAPTALTVNTPASSTTSSCLYADQAAVNAAFTTWLAGFSVSGGCTPTGSYGTPVAPTLCTGGTTTVTYTYSDLCESGTVQASFTINAPTELTVNTPASSTTSACAYSDQAAVNAAFTTWLAGFGISGGCTPTGSYGTPVAPALCTGGTTTVTYTYSDLCESGTVQSTFTVNAPTALTVNAPANSTTSACAYADQAAVNTAFTTWLAGFSVSGGCTPTGSYGTPVAPTLCTGGTTTVTYTYSDLCESGTVQASFTINAPTELTVNTPASSTTSACAYADQDAVNAAFTTWLAGFSVSGGCTPTGSYGTPVAPTLCTGGTTTVTYTYSDLCESGTVQSTFTINAPTELTVNAPSNSTTSSCLYADQAAVNAAFTTWLAGFSVSGGCTPTGSYGTPVAPTLCTGGTTTVTYTYSDLCESGTVQASFTINAPTALTVNAPSNSTTSSCLYADQAAVNAAFTTWLAGFSVSGGCTPTGSYGAPVAPTLCTGGTTTVTYTYSDLCESGSVQSAFTVNAPTSLVISDPGDFSAPATDFADQAAINTAFASWLAGFGVTGGCDPQGSYGTPTAPTLCGGTTVVTYNVTDLCETGSSTASFTIISPNPLVINEPVDFVGSSCNFANQAALESAFTTWLTGFSVSGGFNPQGSIAGTPVAPVLCEGGTTSVTYNVIDECGTGSVTATFTINAPTALTVNTPASSTTSACAYSDQDAVNAAFTTWLAGFGISGGCTPTGSYGTPVAPTLCTGGTTTVTYTYSDLCESGTVQSTFTINAPTALTVNTPASSTTSACAYSDQDAVNAAFTTWLAGFSVSGGCTPTGSYGTPVAPTLCTGGTTTVTYTYSDLCESGTVQASFTINAPTALTVNTPASSTTSACAYADQDAVNAAFTTWLAGFSVSGGCTPTGSYGTPVAPALCTGGTTTVTYTYSDLCESGSVQSAFTVNAPTSLVISDPGDFSAPATDFADQAAINTAFASWLAGFGVTGGCDPQGSYGTPTAPTLCGGTTVVTYNVTDLCETGSSTASFTIISPNPLVINEPVDFVGSSCNFANQAALESAFTTWLTGFSVSGGFNPQGSIAGTPVAPVLCEGGTTSVTYNVIDECGTGSVTATFTINAPTALTVNTPASSTTSACAYSDQAAVNAAFTTWLAGFGISGGCTPTGSYGTPVAPTLCTGGTTTVTYTYSDLCESGTVQSTFTINAPTALTVNTPASSTTSACAYADQAAVNAAFTTWLAGFSVSGGCTPTGSYGTPVAPTLCTGGTTTVTYTYSDLCESGTVQASFTINAPTALTVNTPASSTTSACAYSDQAAVNAAFTTWLAGFGISGGCTPTGSYGTPVAPTLCTGGTTTVTYTYSDLCESGTVQASFTINAPTALTVNTPASSTTSACTYSDQDAVNAAFTTWLAGFSVSGGCTPTGSYGTPVAPTLCTGGTTTVTYTYSDLCESGTVQASFTINAPTALTVNTPASSTTSACAYADQDAVNAAFTTWLAGFSVSGGCTPTGSYGTPVAPALCTGGTTTVTYTYSDLCESGSVQSAFTVNAPTSLVISDPGDFSAPATDFADQAAINTAFASWLAGFGVTGGCDPQGSYGTPTAPTLCGGTTVVTYNVTDLCETGSSTASFTIISPNPLVINEPVDFVGSSCNFANQAALESAFTTWLTGFSVSGGFNPQGSIAGTPVAPVLCEGGTTSVTYNVIDECGTGSVTATFTINAPTALTVNTPASSTTSACAYSDQAAVNAAFTTWLAGFGISGGCTPTGSYGTPVAPTLCTGGTTTVTYTYSDLCESGTVQSTFTINAPTALTVNTPASSTTSACAYSDQAAVNAAFTTWLAGFGISGGCTPTGSYGTPVAPTLCTGGTTTVTYTYSDLCESGTVQASFTINAPTALTVNAPANSTTSACAYSDQDAVNAAFTTWLAGFSVSGGCTPTGSYGTPVAPTLCTGGTTTVTYTYSDLCESGTVQASFTINAPTELTVNTPASSTTSACAYSDQAAVNAAFTTWLAGFGISGGCTPTGFYGTPVAPALCTGGTTTVTYTYSDLCESGTVQSTFTILGDNMPPTVSNNPSLSIIADCDTQFIDLPWQMPEWMDNCGSVIPVSDVIDPPSQTSFPATYTRTWIVEDGCGNGNSFVQTIQVPNCEIEYCTVTQYTLGSSIGSFCDGTSSYDLMNSLLIENGPVIVGIPANNRSFTVPVDGGAQCIIDRFPTYNNAFVLTGNWGCGNFGNLLQTDGRFNNSLLVEAITMQFNLWMTPALADLVLDSPEFYIRSSSGCGGGDNVPLDDATHFVLPQSVYNYLGADPTVQDLFNLANLALGSASLPGPNAPTLANIKYSLRWINEAFENCGFIYFVPPLTHKIELAKTGTYIDNAPTGIYNAGDQIEYEFAVSNIGDLTLTDIIINDPKVSVTGGPIVSLAPGDTDNTTFSAVYTITEADLIAGSLTNTAIVIGFAGTSAYYDTDSDVQTFILPDRILDLEVFLEGLYDGTGVMRQATDENGPHFGTGIADHITVELHSASDYSSIVYTIDDVELGINGQATVHIPYIYSGSYYVTIRHRNSLETTSSVPVSMSSGSVSYAFDAPSKAFGGNLLQMITGEYVIFGGDVNQDGIVDTADMTPVDNDAAGFVSGYNANDANGDGIVDTADMTIVDNNAAGFAGSITP
ncbi:MAG: hypothetical protein AB9834_12700 [Lentimicrobium sp.]